MPHTAETLPNGTPLYTTPNFPLTTDSLLLTAFCPLHRGWSVCDLGCGSGPILLGLVDRGLSGPALGIELQAEGAALLTAAAEDAVLPNVTALCADFRTYTPARPFDLVVSNPPYFSSGAPSPNPARAAARHSAHCTPAQLCTTAHHILKDGGSFCLCWPPARLAALIFELISHNLAPKRLQFVRKSHESAPWLCLIDARRAGGEGLTLLPDHILPPGTQAHY